MPTYPFMLQEFVRLTVEARKMREVDVSDGSRVPHGSRKHIKDLEARIAGLLHFRDKHKKGSEARANYSRLVQRLKGELGSAKRAAGKGTKLKEAEELLTDDGKWWANPALKDPDSPSYMSHQDRWEKMATEPEFSGYVDLVVNADDPKALNKAQKMVTAAIDAGKTDMTDGMLAHFVSKRKAQLKAMDYRPRSATNARTDRLLRTRDSSGKATPRKF